MPNPELNMPIKRLSDAQLAHFDTEYVTPLLWKNLTKRIDADFPSGDFRFLDVGGGSGRFTDRLLAAYPQARGTILDNSSLLLGRNKPHARKHLIEDSAEHMHRFDRRYDLVFFNWVLHHLVGDGYRDSLAHIDHALRAATGLLTPRGRISVFENIYDGLIVGNAPSHIIFGLTSARAIAPLIHRLGANTARVGVCFQSKAGWQRILSNAGIDSLDYEADSRKHVPWTWRAFLHVGELRCGMFWGTSMLNAAGGLVRPAPILAAARMRSTQRVRLPGVELNARMQRHPG
mgnify:CR=1 FL=1